MSSKTDMECYNSGWQDGYIEACCDILIMLASVPESKEINEVKETITKVLNHDDR